MKKILLTIFTLLTFFGFGTSVFAVTTNYSDFNVDTKDSWVGWTLRNSNSSFKDILGIWWQQLVYDSEVTNLAWARQAGWNIVKSVKNVIIILASVVLLFMVIKLLGAGSTEEEVKRLKSGIVSVGLGIFLMQTAYSLVMFFTNANAVNGSLALDINRGILLPLTSFLLTFWQITFLFMGTWAAFKLTTALGNDEKIKQAKSMVTAAIIGFLLLQIPKVLVRVFYGDVTNPDVSGSEIKLNLGRLSELSGTLVKILEYVSSFLWIAIVLLIIYAGYLLAVSSGQEEGVKKAKAILMYIVIGCILLMGSYLLLQLILNGVILS